MIFNKNKLYYRYFKFGLIIEKIAYGYRSTHELKNSSLEFSFYRYAN